MATCSLVGGGPPVGSVDQPAPGRGRGDLQALSMLPNKRLKLPGGDRFKGIGLFVSWRARPVVQHPSAGGPGRPQLKRDPLGEHTTFERTLGFLEAHRCLSRDLDSDRSRCHHRFGPQPWGREAWAFCRSRARRCPGNWDRGCRPREATMACARGSPRRIRWRDSRIRGRGTDCGEQSPHADHTHSDLCAHRCRPAVGRRCGARLAANFLSACRLTCA